MGALTFSADIDITQFSRKIKQLDNSLTLIAQKAANSGSILDNSFKKAGTSAAGLSSDLGGLQRSLLGLASVATLGRLGQQVINIRGEFQQLGIAFEVMLGSKEKADKLMQEQIAFAAKTPFTLTDVATNTKQLLAMGIATEKVMATMKALGDVAAGTSVPIARVAINYGQVATLGKLQGRELRDFAMAGIPLIDELAKNLGRAKSEIADMVTAGQIGFPEVEKAFQTMAGEGGKFYNLMERQNASVTGQISNLTDKLQVMFNEIGKSNEGLIYGGISGLGGLISHYQEILDILKVIVATYGTYRAALIAVSAAQSVTRLSENIQLMMMFRKELGLATAAQQAFNTASKANVYVLTIAALAGLVTALYSFTKSASESTKVSVEFNNSLTKETEAIEKNFKALTDAKEGSIQRAEAIRTINDKYKEYLPNLITEKDSLLEIKKAQDAVTESMAKSLAFKDQQDELSSIKTNVDSQLNTFYSQIDKASDKLNDIQKGKFKALLEQYKDQAALSFKNLGYFPANLSSGVGDLFSKISGLSFGKGIGGSGISGIELSIKDLILAEIELDQKTKGLSSTYESYLEALGLTNKTTNDSSAALKTVQDQIEETQQAIIEGEKKLSEMRSSGSTATKKEIEDQKAAIDEYKKTLEILTGVSQKQKKSTDDLKAAQEDLEKAVKSGNKTQIEASAKRLTVLEAEKKKLEEIISLELQRAWSSQFDRQSVKPITSIGSKTIVQVGSSRVNSGIREEVVEIDNIYGPIWKKSKLEVGKLNKQVLDGIKKAAKDQEDLDKEKTDRSSKYYEDSISFMDSLLMKYGEMLGMTEEQAGLISSLAKGDYFAAVFNMIGIIGTFFKAEKDYMSDYYKSLNEQTNKLLENINLINLSLTNIGSSGSLKSFSLISSELLRLKNEATRLNEQLVIVATGDGRHSNTGTQNTGTSGRTGTTDEESRSRTILDLSKQTAELYTEIEELTYKLLDPNLTEEQRIAIKELLDTYNGLLDSIDNSIRDITGTTVQELGNSLIDAFAAGENAAIQWGETLDDIIRNVVKEQLIAQLLTKPISQAIDILMNDAADGLSPEEAAKFDKSMKTLFDVTQPVIEQVNESFKAMGIDLFDSVDSLKANSLTGAVQGITEDTASIISGQMMAIRVDIKANQNIMINQLELMDQGLSILQNIEKNTRNNSELPGIKAELVEMNRQIKNLA
ncbi:MAG: tape measure protein [Prolixibacteraceae bacterium]